MDGKDVITDEQVKNLLNNCELYDKSMTKITPSTSTSMVLSNKDC